MELRVKIKKVHLIRTHGTDIISLTAFPIMKYDTVIKIECQQGYGEEYCRTVLGLEPVR